MLILKLTTFFISSMIDCVINVEDEKRKVINRNESDEKKDKET